MSKVLFKSNHFLASKVMYGAVTHELARISDFCNCPDSQSAVAAEKIQPLCLQEYAQKQEQAEFCPTKMIISTEFTVPFQGDIPQLPS